MERIVFGNYNNRIALVYKQTDKVVSFITIQPVGLVIEKLPIVKFKQEYYREPKYTAEQAVSAYLKAAVRSFYFNEKAVSILKEIIMINNIESSEQTKAYIEAASKPTAAQEKTEAAKVEKAEKVKAAKPPKEKKPKGPTIGSFCMGLIKEGKSNAEIVSMVADEFPGANTKVASVAWYRSQIKRLEKAND